MKWRGRSFESFESFEMELWQEALMHSFEMKV
jgi:hypothetical protein